MSHSPPIFYDTETCGLSGPVVLIQWAEGDGPVELHDVWYEPIYTTIDLVTKFMNHPGGLVGFNMAFDHFQLQKIYNLFIRFPDQNAIPISNIQELALLEEGARDGDCLKPVGACDLMLVARRGPYQSTMQRKAIAIRRIPTVLADELAHELEERVALNAILFSKRKNPNLPRWRVSDCTDRTTGKIDPNFKDLILKFRPSYALKVIAADLLGADRYNRKRSVYKDIEVPRQFWPAEAPFAPFATAISKPQDNWIVSSRFVLKELRGRKTWPAVIKHHAEHWRYDSMAREYAADDVLDTRGIYKAFDCPPMNDVDSTLACMVASCRWRGYAIDIPGIKALKEKMQKIAKSAPKSAREAKDYISASMTPFERLSFKSTKKMILEEMVPEPKQNRVGWLADCPKCEGEGMHDGQPCINCESSGAVRHPASFRAEEVLLARAAKKEVEIYDKLLLAGRFHASFNISGTLSNRMSGADKFNPQAIKSSKDVRSLFLLASNGFILCGGDFEAFEVSLAEANYNDTKLREQLLSYTPCYKCGGNNPKCDDCQGTNQTKMKIHALFGTMCFPAMSYEQIVKDKVVYTRSKSGFFSKIYGGNYATLMTRLGVDEKAAIEAEMRFDNTYEGVKRARLKIENGFCSMRQPNGIGTNVEWHQPDDYIENMMRPPFRRYFTIENSICKALYDLSVKMPPALKELGKGIKVQRDLRNRERIQTGSGAIQSALYGAAFQIQAANMRAAANHVIQSTGAEITKKLQVDLWTLQPTGIDRWMIQPFNVHDEVMAPARNEPALLESVLKIVSNIIAEFKPMVPLIGIDWHNGLSSWGAK